ncbi:transthyretin-like family protein [Calycomorphotria hydatis]|uniref:Carboxypeptidase regulatory-like domain-containing protein n=1 Tax=Calycomorphotria hydatis TaxID=2528027 RepID=A0A517TAM4_9PLAN|nr:hypothetical protein [Calycomorphotria hydatis]QDT65422.1 hypothetical protein V22_26750 [Calycomorphotria hydatis]
MSEIPHKFSVTFTALACLLFVGCSSGDVFPLKPVSGKVTLDGEPLAGVMIFFTPRLTGDGVKSGPPSYAVIADDGTFQLQTARQSSKSGAVAGPHLVTFSTEAAPDDPSEVIYHVPKAYREGIEYTVPKDGTDSAVFELTSDQ